MIKQTFMNRRIVFFLLIAFGIPWTLYLGGFAEKLGEWSAMLGMWGPGLAATLTWLLFPVRRGVVGRQAFSRRRFWGMMGKAYLLPFAYALPVYGLLWLSGWGPFNTGFRADYLTLLTLGQIGNLLAACGEELGWRGFLYPELVKTWHPEECGPDGGTKRKLFSPSAIWGRATWVTGLIWFCWHLPMIMQGDSFRTPAWYALGCFFLMIMGLNVLMSYVRARSGSFWPAAVLHASHNFLIQGILNNLVLESEYRDWIYGEFGIGVALMIAVWVGVLMYPHRKSLSPVKAVSFS